MKGRNVCGFAGSLDAFLSERQARRTGFMLLVHKFPINGARISRRPSRSCWSTRSIVFSEIFLDLFFALTGYLSFVRLPVSAVPPAAFLRPADAVAAARSSPSSRSSVCLRECHAESRRRHARKFSNLLTADTSHRSLFLLRRSISSDVLEKRRRGVA